MGWWAGGLYELDKWVAGLISYVIIRWRRRADPVQSEGEERRGEEGRGGERERVMDEVIKKNCRSGRVLK